MKTTLLGKVSVKLLVAWYDIWVGMFVDTAKRRIYIFPVPCVGVVIELSKAPPESNVRDEMPGTAGGRGATQEETL